MRNLPLDSHLLLNNLSPLLLPARLFGPVNQPGQLFLQKKESQGFYRALGRPERISVSDKTGPGFFMVTITRSEGLQHDIANQFRPGRVPPHIVFQDRKSTRLNSSHVAISYAVS